MITKRARAVVILVAGTGVLAGCAGPAAPFDIGTQNAPVSLTLGEHQAVVEAPVGPISAPLPPSIAPFVPIPDVEPTESASPAPVTGCPVADPTAPVVSGGLYLPGAPSDGSYQYRTKTTDQVGKQKASYKGNSTWKVSSVKDQTTGGYDVTIETSIGKTTTTRVFRVQPKAVPSDVVTHIINRAYDKVFDLISGNADPTTGLGLGIALPPLPLPSIPRVARYGGPGIYLVSQTTGDSTFKPTTPITLMRSPLAVNDSFLAVGTDGQSVMEFTSTVTRRQAVDACGTKLETAQVELTDGIVAGLSPDGKVQKVDFTETLNFGMQFGGLLLHDSGTVSGLTLPGGSLAPDTIERTFDFTINQTPKGPKV